MLRPGYGAALLFAFTAASAQAQSEIVVTGRGLDPVEADRAYDMVEIGRERLAFSASNRLEDILRDVPGFQLFRRSDASSANPTSQGVTLRALGGNASSRALLVLDGVPQSDPFGGWISWPAYDPQRLGRVTVTRGGGSGIWGPGALAGTIEMDSAGPADLRGGSLSLAYGSRDGIDAHAGVGARLGTGFASIAAAYARGDGFVPVVAEQRGPIDRPAPYEQGSVALRLVAPMAAGVELQASGLAFSDRRERGTAFSAIRTRGLDGSLRLVGRRWSALAYVQTRQFYNSFASIAAGRTAVSQASEQYNVPATGLGARIELRPRLGEFVSFRIGADWRRTSGVTRERFSFVGGIGTRQRQAGGETDSAGAFAEAAWQLNSVTLTAAARLDHWAIGGGFLRERVFATGTTLADLAFPDRSGWEPTGRAGMVWRAGEALSLRAAAYRGWRLPTLNELYRPFRAGTDATGPNAALRPERVAGAEAGIDWRPADRLRLGAGIFVNRLDGAIANVTLGQGPGAFPIVGFVPAGGQYRQRRNLDAIVARGVEVDASLALGAWTLSAGWSWVDAEVRAAGAAAALAGLRPAQTPRLTGAATLGWRGSGGLRASLTGRYVGAQFEDDLNAQSLPDAFTADLSLAVPLTARLALEARAQNVANARVFAGIGGDGTIERATPRTLWVGISWGRLR
jgi:outer membrane receptor protein involved in Fe transport